MATALLVVGHHRADSLTAHIADRTRVRLEKDGHTVDVLDLHAEGFDPRMTVTDEPDWDDRDKIYSAEVRAHMRRIDASGLVIVVFPVWWYGLPAVLKGWIDRVWNYGFAYGRRTARLGGKRMLWLALAGQSREEYAGHGLGDALAHQLRVGISNYCGITDVAVRFVHDTVSPVAPGPATAADDALEEFLAPS
ncbi:NAD(P)H oxidoreductase [Actinomadura sp. NAK00032]|uniref:NAD(P)H oxidoreductase n=1 Tax=Actinomadura sp. NAK00032 TaxID=2742128 RepID=UPI0015901AD7|nr:NAD(P)H oxidoreductase [Actinomadura sp. NAK00032]QKW36900.1 NAD(P)H oxidoreductase [Actinomadura sp. NAK00032]